MSTKYCKNRLSAPCRLTIIFITVLLGSCSKLPNYGGKSLPVWLADLDFHNTEEKRNAAKNAIKQIGTNALPYLLGQVTKLSNIDQKQASDPAVYEQWQSLLDAFAALGSNANPAVSDLTSRMEAGGRSSCLAAELLIRIGTNGLPPIVVALTNASLPVRVCIASKITECGSNAVAALPELIDCLKYGTPKHDETLQLRFNAAVALGSLRESAENAVPALMQALQSDDDTVRFAAARALGNFGTNATIAIPVLMEAKQNPNPHVSTAAVNSLETIENLRVRKSGSH